MAYKGGKSFEGYQAPLLLIGFLLLVVIERIADVSYLDDIVPGLGLMTFLTSSNLLVFAFALFLKAYRYWFQAKLVGFVGLLFALFNLFDWSDYADIFTPPSIGTSWMLLLLGMAICVSQFKLKRQYRYLSEILAGSASALALTSILGLLVGREALDDLGPFSTTSFFTSVSVFIIGLSDIRLIKDGAVFSLYKDKGVAGRFVRKLLLLVVGAMVLLAILASPSVGPNLFSSSSDLILIFGLILSLILFFIFSLGEMFRREIMHADQAEKDAAQRELYLDKTLEIAPVGIMIADEFGYISAANPAVCHIHGYPEGALVGMSMIELVPKARRTDFSILWSDMFKEGEVKKLGRSGDLKALKRDGTECFIEFYVTVLELAEGRMAVCSVNDVSERIATQHQLELWNTELQARINEATRDLNKSNEELLQRNSELQQFTYAASHDLQSPLRGIGVYAGVLKADYGDRLDDEGIQHIDYIVAEAKRLQQLINDLLNYARIDTKSREGFEDVELNQVIRDVENQLKRNQDVEFELVYEDLPRVQGIKSLLVQLFYNLIENAIKYRSDERPPRITLSSYQESQGYTTVIEVADNGLGVDPRYQDRIFEVFKRLHSQEEIPGTGIGLAICKRIAERHGGNISVTSEPNVGSTFAVRFASQPSAADTEIVH